MSDLYDEDFTLWAERQAALLRRRAAGADALEERGLLTLPEEPPFTIQQALVDALSDDE